MSEPLKCVICGVELTTVDADHAIVTDDGPVHRECYDGDLPPDGMRGESIDLEAENERRRDHGDVLVDWKVATEYPPAGDPDAQLAGYRTLLGADRGHRFHEAMARGVRGHG